MNSNIEAERDHLRVGDHFVRVLTMKEAITETRPLVLDSLLKIAAQLLCRDRVDAACSGQGPQGSHQTPPPLQYVEDRLCVADGYPDQMSFANSDALFATGDLSVAIGREYKGQCETLCFGPHPSWEIVQARFMELRSLL